MHRTIAALLSIIGPYPSDMIGQPKASDVDLAIQQAIEAIRDDKVEGRQSGQELSLIGRICDPENRFEDLLKYAKGLSEKAAEKETKKTLDRYVAVLETMVRNRKEREGEKNEIKNLIYSLRDQQEFWNFTTEDAKSPAARLLAIGREAIPYLIDELENDELTRSATPEISTNREVLRRMHVLRIGDCACGILEQITGQGFGDSRYIHDPARAKMSPKQVREKAKKWWEGQKQK